MLIIGISLILNSTISSSLPAEATPFILDEFHITHHREVQLVLPISVALVGYVFGPLLFGPLSETFGRKPILLGSFVLYIVSSAASALAPGWPSFLVSRFLVGTSSAAPYAVVGAMFADLYSDPVHRGRANSAFLTVSVLKNPRVTHF